MMASVSKRKWTHNGKAKTAWIARYHDENGQRRQQTFDRQREAEAFLDKVKTEISTGVHVSRDNSRTIADLCDIYMRNAEDRMRDGRIGRNRHMIVGYCVNRSIIPRLGKVLAIDLTAQMVEDFYRDMVREDNLAPRTAKERVYMLREIETLAIKRGHLKSTPVSTALLELKGIRQEKIRTFSAEEVGRVASQVRNRRYVKTARLTDLLECYFHIAAFSGLRFGEIQALTLDNVDLDRRVIYVRHNLTRFDELKGPKTRAGIRDVPMLDHVATLLTAWIERHYIPNDRKLIFRTRFGAQLIATNFLKHLWYPLLQRCDLGGDDKPHFHALRHFCASYWVSKGMPITDVAALLGHNKFDMTLQTYAHPMMAHQHRLATMQSAADDILILPPVVVGTRRAQQLLTH